MYRGAGALGKCTADTGVLAYSEFSQRSQVGRFGAKNVALFLREPLRALNEEASGLFMTRYSEIDLSGIRPSSGAHRISKVRLSEGAVPPRCGMTVREFLEGLPVATKANDLKAVAHAVVKAKMQEKPVIVLFGGHVVKTGCSPILADLVRNGYITHFASNGAVAIHDCELALFGSTSEDVARSLQDGTFGMASETACLINGAADRAVEREEGLGEAMGAALLQQDPGALQHSLIALAYSRGIPFTLHIALGTDIVHQHPSANGAAIGEASMRDFRILGASVSELGDGGVVLNMGSAVIMPEVFLKCLAVARNLDSDLAGFTTANFDMIQHYRPSVNIVQRPVFPGGSSYAITGHHEIMIPLLAAAIYEAQT